MPLRLNHLLIDEGLNPADVRLLRHQTGKVVGRTPYSLWRDDPQAFEAYQSLQAGAPRERSRFRAQYWASFVAPPGGGTLFVGLYSTELLGPAPDGAICALRGEPIEPGYDLYRCQLSNLLAEYAGRLAIDWGESTRAWVQRADNQDKVIVELTRAFQEETFPGFTKLIRSFSEIETMPITWKEILRASRGVYLLACPHTREHYVGSAYGDEGFLGRWRAYVTNGHGGNVGLRARDASDYLVSILEVAGSSATVEEIITLEANWKLKLHSRDIGLNLN